MNGYEVQRWERTKEIARACGATWRVYECIEFYDNMGFSLGAHGTVAEAFAFICGYEHSIHPNSKKESEGK